MPRSTKVAGGASSTAVSKSLGNYPHPEFFRSQSTNLSKIVYAGWLYKRSNQPIVSPTNVATGGTTSVSPQTNHTATTAIHPQQSVINPQVPTLPFPSVLQAGRGLFAPEQPQSNSEVAPARDNEGSSNSNDAGHNSAAENRAQPSQSSTQYTEPGNQDLQDTGAWHFLCTLLDAPDAVRIGKESFSVTPSHQDSPQPTAAMVDGSSSRLSSSPIPVPSLPPTANTTSKLSVHSRSSPVRRSHSHAEHGSAEDWKATEDILAADGHVWRARYCVLEDGVLYFYRHKAIAVSDEAVAERQDDSETAAEEEAEVLKQQQKLPTHRAPALSSSFLQPNTNRNRGIPGNRSILAQSPRIPKARTHLWEKRLGLVFVGSVRTAEGEYGQHALELSSLEPDNDDSLILRARNAEEMNEWFFQLHRSIEVFIKNIMTTSLWHDVGEMIVPSSGSPVWFSPRLRPVETPVPMLSHGHGRSRRHRERDAGSDDAMHPVLPDDALSQTPLRVTTTIPFIPEAHVEDLVNRNGASPTVNLRPATPPVFDLDDDFLPPEQTAPTPPESQHPPAPRSGKYIPPHLRQMEPPRRAYVPPHLRRKQGTGTGTGTVLAASGSAPGATLAIDPPVSPEARLASDGTTQVGVQSIEIALSASERTTTSVKPFVLGGCADPEHVQGSILDDRFIPRKASKLYRTKVKPFGWTQSSRWEIGAVSECGARDSNEDAYLVVADLWEAFATMEDSRNSLEDLKLTDPPAIFCVFDGHCGDQAARYAAEKFIHYLHEAARNSRPPGVERLASEHVEELIRQALLHLDADFCKLCIQDGRTWEAGTTALIAALLDDDLIVANLGDARGVLSRSVEATLGQREYEKDAVTSFADESTWLVLNVESDTDVDSSTGGNSGDSDADVTRQCVYKYVTRTHSPSRPDELTRIEQSNGWVTTEQEIPVSQALRLDLHDELARDILNRALAREDGGAAAPHRMIRISRVCGELAVSRALGDRDFKANGSDVSSWPGAVFLPYPENHSKSFTGDLVSNIPEVQAMRIRPAGAADEFLLLACDGLWDVMDADDAVRVTRQLLLEEKMPAREAAGRLAKLAMHLGSSDNISIIIVSFVG